MVDGRWNTCSAKAGQNLVGDQLRAMAAGNCRDTAKPACWLRDHASRALNERLNHHRCVRISAPCLRSKLLLDLSDAFPIAPASIPGIPALRLRAIERTPVAIGRHHPVRFEKQPRVSPVKQFNVAEADRTHGVAVIRVRERQKSWLLAPTGAAGDFIG